MEWIRLLSVLWEIVEWFDRDAQLERSEYLRASEARQLVSRVRTDLQASGVEIPRDSAHGAEYWSVFQSAVSSILRKLDVNAA